MAVAALLVLLAAVAPLLAAVNHDQRVTIGTASSFSASAQFNTETIVRILL